MCRRVAFALLCSLPARRCCSAPACMPACCLLAYQPALFSGFARWAVLLLHALRAAVPCTLPGRWLHKCGAPTGQPLKCTPRLSASHSRYVQTHCLRSAPSVCLAAFQCECVCVFEHTGPQTHKPTPAAAAGDINGPARSFLLSASNCTARGHSPANSSGTSTCCSVSSPSWAP